MIGNDVVDLRLAAVQSNWRRKGFIEKVFTSQEQELITTAIDPDHIVWLLWSMKEAAYKIHQRRYKLQRRLNWLGQECHILCKDNSGASGKVRIEKDWYYTSSEISMEALCSFAVKDKNLQVKNVLLKNHGREAKAQLKKELAKRFLLDPTALAVKKDPEGIPFVTYRERLFFSSFSLSSHGRFSGYSCALMNS